MSVEDLGSLERELSSESSRVIAVTFVVAEVSFCDQIRVANFTNVETRGPLGTPNSDWSYKRTVAVTTTGILQTIRDMQS